MKLGKFNINVLDTGNFRLDGGAMFGVVPKVLWEKKYTQADSFNRIPLAARPLLIEFDNKKILVDTGNGTKRDHKFNEMYEINSAKNNLNMLLQNYGLKSCDITDVILTHLHFDHTGGSTIIENEKVVPAFPNAKYYIQKKHFEWALNPSDKDKASFIKEDFTPLINEGLITFTNGKTELFNGIEVIPVSGHTESMQLVYLESRGESLLYIADLAPTAAHLTYTYGLAYDNEPIKTISEKKNILPDLFEKNTIICFEHDAFLQACRLNKNEKGFFAGEKIIISSNE